MLVAEIGTDMRRWLSAQHLTSWLTPAPKNKVPGGKLLHAQTQPSANRAALPFRLAAACRAYLRMSAFSSRHVEQPSPAVIRWIYTAALLRSQGASVDMSFGENELRTSRSLRLD